MNFHLGDKREPIAKDFFLNLQLAFFIFERQAKNDEYFPQLHPVFLIFFVL